MTTPLITKETPMNLFEVKKELQRIKKRDKELNYRSTKTEDYIQQLDLSSKAEELKAKIDKLKIPRLKEQHIQKIIDLIPTSVKDLKVILQGYILTVNNDNLKKIIDVIAKEK